MLPTLHKCFYSYLTSLPPKGFSRWQPIRTITFYSENSTNPVKSDKSHDANNLKWKHRVVHHSNRLKHRYWLNNRLEKASVTSPTFSTSLRKEVSHGFRINMYEQHTKGRRSPCSLEQGKGICTVIYIQLLIKRWCPLEGIEASCSSVGSTELSINRGW